MEELKDQDLIKQYLKGDKKALETLISRYLNQVYGFIFYLTKNSQDAEDIAQETFVKVWKNLKNAILSVLAPRSLRPLSH